MRMWALIPGLLLVAACSSGDPELDPDVEYEVARVGAAAADSLAHRLVNRLGAAMREGGAAHAIEFCSERALPITDSVDASLPRRLGVKRTALRVRNTANAPDSLEVEALRFFHASFDSAGTVPQHYVQVVDDSTFRYYRPLRIQELCVQCHGTRDELGPGVAEALANRYPWDDATGYRKGDLRGVIRVSVPASALP